MRTHLRKTKISGRGNVLLFDKGVGLDLRNEPQRRARRRLIEAERMSAIGRMTCSISHDMRHSLTAIYANAEFLERHDICASARADMVLDIREAVLAMTERIDSLLQFSSSGRKTPLVHERVAWVVEKAVAAAKMHPDAHDVSITVGTLSPAQAERTVGLPSWKDIPAGTGAQLLRFRQHPSRPSRTKRARQQSQRRQPPRSARPSCFARMREPPPVDCWPEFRR